MVLHFDPVAIELENRNQWIEAADYLYEQWKREPQDKNGILCAGVLGVGGSVSGHCPGITALSALIA